MKFNIGDTIRVSDVTKINKGYLRGLSEDEEYLVVGQCTAGYPILLVKGTVFFSKRFEENYMIRTKVNMLSKIELQEHIDQLIPYVPVSEELVALIDKLEQRNNTHSINKAIDIALDSNDYHSLQNLLKYIK